MERDEEEKELERDEIARLGSSFQDKGKHTKACFYCVCGVVCVGVGGRAGGRAGEGREAYMLLCWGSVP